MPAPVKDILKFAMPACARAARFAKVGPGLKHLDEDDIAAELMVSVSGAIPDFHGERGSIEVFFGKVIGDALKEIKRREFGPKARRQRVKSLEELEVEPVDPASEGSGDGDDLHAAVRVVLEGASGEEQEVVSLAAHIKVSQIARALNLDRSQVRTALRRAGKRFGEDFFDRFANWGSARRDRE